MAVRRVVITGLGVISALGPDKDPFRQALSRGQSGIGPLEGIDEEGLRIENAAQVRDYDAREHFDDATALLLDRFAQFAVVAARGALRDAGLEREEIRGNRTA